ncbi:MAG: tape measure protein [Fimbriiglobus sp.]
MSAGNTTELENMVVRLTGDGSSYLSMLSTAQRASAAAGSSIAGMGTTAQSTVGSVRGFAMGAVGMLTPLLGIGLSLQSAFKGVSLAAQAEEMETAFGVMLGSAEKGVLMVQQLQDFAAATPLGTQDIQSATKTLLQFGTAGGDIIPTLKMLGDTVGGNAERLQSMALAFGQMSSTGRLMGGELGQMISAGFNPLQEMAEDMAKRGLGGVNENMLKLKDQMEKGKISVDMVKESFKRATSDGGKYFDQMNKQSQTLGGLFSTMQDDIDSVLRDIGQSIVKEFDLKNLLKDISGAAKATVAWFQGMSDGTKKAIAALFAAVLVIGLVTTAIIIAGTVFNTMFGGIGIWIGVIAAVAVGIAALIVQVGGVGAAFQWVKAQALAAWEWLEPVKKAVVSFFTAFYDVAVKSFNDLKATATDVWKSVFGDSSVDWKQVQDEFQNVFIAMEYGVKNFGKVWDLAASYIAYKLVQTGNMFMYWFTDAIPAAVLFFVNNWRKIIKEGFDTALTMAVNYVANYITLITSIPDLIRGKVGLDDVQNSLVPMLDGVKSTWSKFKLPDRKESLTEEMLRKDFEMKKGSITDDYAEFRRKKLEEFAKEEDAGMGGDWGDLGEGKGQEMAKGLGKGLASGADAVMRGSAEALSRIAEYRDKLNDSKMMGGGGVGASGPAGQVRAADAAGLRGAEAQGRKDENTQVLKDIRDTLKKQDGKPTANIGPADLTGSGD